MKFHLWASYTAAFVCACAVPIFLLGAFALLAGPYVAGFFLVGNPPFLMALAYAVILGGPVVFLLKRRGWFNLLSCGLLGATIGFIAIGATIWSVGDRGQSSSMGGVPTVIDGVPTLAGWLRFAEFGFWAGAIPGVLGGLIFWAVLNLTGHASHSVATANDGTAPANPTTGQKLAAPILLVAAIGLAMVTVFPQEVLRVFDDRS